MGTRQSDRSSSTATPVRAAALLALLAGSALPRAAKAQSTEPFPAQFELSSLLPENGGDGTNGFVLEGIDWYDGFGVSASPAGDVNGDGFDDLLVGSSGGRRDDGVAAGICYIIFGGPGVATTGLIDLAALDGTDGLALHGVDKSTNNGSSVSSAGDVNHDGIADIISGAPGSDPSGIDVAGKSYVVFGSSDLRTSRSGGSFDLSLLDGTNGFVLNGIAPLDYSGNSVSSAGDFNGDGIDDIIIGAPFVGPDFSHLHGASYVVFGAADLGAGGVGTGGSFNLSGLDGLNGVTIVGREGSNSWDGWAVSGAGDVNGDGIDDLIIGGISGCYVIFGATDLGTGDVFKDGTFELWPSTVNGKNGFALYGATPGRNKPSVSKAGDVNGDGIDDLIVGAECANPNGNLCAGESYVVFGAPDLGASGLVDVSSLDGPNGFTLYGNALGDKAGRSVASAGDVNGDGLDDLIIGARYAAPAPTGTFWAGVSYVVYGAEDLGTGGVGTGGRFALAELDGSNGFAINGIHPGDYSGFSVSSAGDIDGDGVGDIVIGAVAASPGDLFRAGETYVVFGRDLVPCPADLNGDGDADQGDVQAFITLFLTQDHTADFNADGILDFGDIGRFVESYLEGC